MAAGRQPAHEIGRARLLRRIAAGDLPVERSVPRLRGPRQASAGARGQRLAATLHGRARTAACRTAPRSRLCIL